MAREGRIHGRVNGATYDLIQFGGVRQSLPLAEVHENKRLLEAIRKNGWEQP